MFPSPRGDEYNLGVIASFTADTGSFRPLAGMSIILSLAIFVRKSNRFRPLAGMSIIKHPK